MNSWMNKDTPQAQAPVEQQPAEKRNEFTDEENENWLFNSDEQLDKFVCLVVGADGTGKTPITLSYLTDDDIKNGKKVVVIDLDGGNLPLISKYHKKRCENLGKKVTDVFLVRNPQKEVVTEDGVEVDYTATFHRIKGVVKLLKSPGFIQKHNIKYIIFDGLSTALNHAENQMRVEKNIDVDGGVSLKYWLIRNKLFKETLDSIKSLPISSFFIAHEDFLTKEGRPQVGKDEKEKDSSIKLKTNAMMHQKIFCQKIISLGKTTFVATVLKSKYNVKKEGAKITFGEVQNATGEVTFTPERVLEELV